jgi:hypothetical protein
VRPWIGLAVAAATPVIALFALGIEAGADNPAARVRLFAALPEWTGIWETEAAMQLDRGVFPPVPKLWREPPYTPVAQKKYAPAGFPLMTAKNAFDFQSRTATEKLCQPLGFPSIMEMPVGDFLFELLVTPEQTLLLAQDGTVRHIYTDGRPHPKPADLWPTPSGDSIGHWEGQTLVIDTIARTPGPIAGLPGIERLGTANLSVQAHFTERLRRIGTDTLEDVMTIEDPLRFTHPWQVKIRYARLKDLDRLIPTDCEHDRNTVGDKFGIAPPR